jgi:hypothetical protein
VCTPAQPPPLEALAGVCVGTPTLLPLSTTTICVARQPFRERRGQGAHPPGTMSSRFAPLSTGSVHLRTTWLSPRSSS